MKITKEIQVGLFTVIALILLYLGFYYLKGVDFFSTSKNYYAVYDNVDKLMISNQVYLNGLEIGRVSDIRILRSKQNKVLVELAISSGVIPTDSTIAVLSSDFLGNKSILLNMDKVGRPLEPGDTITSILEKGLADLLEKADPVADNLQATLRKLNTILDNLVNNSGNLDTIFDEFKETPRLLNYTMLKAGSKMDSLSYDLHAVAENLDGTVTSIKPVITNLTAFSDSLRTLQFNETLVKTQQLIARMNDALSKLGDGETTMSRLMTEDSLYVNMNNLVLSLDTLARHMNSYPKHFFAPLGKSHRKIERELRKQED